MNKIKIFIQYISKLKWIILLIIAIIFVKNYININNKYENSVSLYKAALMENSEVKNKARVYQLNIEQLQYFNDSIIDKLNNVKEELGIKDKNLKEMQYLLSQAQRRDTITFTDTLFREPSLNLDTIMGDKWYQMNLGLRFPNVIITEPKFISEKYIMVSYRKETINPPKKCFIARWFQRKHKIVEVEVVEKNPYIENKQQRFIEILK